MDYNFRSGHLFIFRRSCSCTPWFMHWRYSSFWWKIHKIYADGKRCSMRDKLNPNKKNPISIQLAPMDKYVILLYDIHFFVNIHNSLPSATTHWAHEMRRMHDLFNSAVIEHKCPVRQNNFHCHVIWYPSNCLNTATAIDRYEINSMKRIVIS